MLINVDYVVEICVISVISDWRCWVTWLGIVRNGTDALTLHLPLDLEFHYPFMHTFRFCLSIYILKVKFFFLSFQLYHFDLFCYFYLVSLICCENLYQCTSVPVSMLMISGFIYVIIYIFVAPKHFCIITDISS